MDDERKVFYRDIKTGDLGHIHKEGGKTYIWLDRPQEKILSPFRKTQWQLDKKHMPLSPYQVVQVCFAADRALCLILGLHEKAGRDWPALSEEQRIGWVETGPAAPTERVMLYRAIRKSLAHLTKASK